MKPLVVLAAAVLLAQEPAFPPPKLIAETPDLRCDWARVTELRAEGSELVLATDAGPFVLSVGRDTRVAGADDKPLGSVRELHQGQKVRAYYVVDRGARGREIDVLP